MKFIDKMQFIIIVRCQPIMLQCEKTGMRPSKKDLCNMTHTRKDVTPVGATSDEVIVYFYFRNSIIILVV